MRGEVVAHFADVLVDAENLLDDDDAALRRAGRIGPIGAELEGVGRGERELLTQMNLPMLSTLRTGRAASRRPVLAPLYHGFAGFEPGPRGFGPARRTGR